MKKGLVILPAIVFVFALALSACSGGGSGTPPAESAAPSSSAGGNTGEGNGNEGNAGTETASEYDIPDGTTITIVNGGGSSVEQQMAMYGDLLVEKFPNVNFVFKGTTSELKIDKMILGGEKFDIYLRSVGYFFQEVPDNGFEYDMTELMSKHQVDLSGIDPVLMKSMTDNAGGKLWGVPVLNSTIVMYYNKDLFDNFGVDYPTDGMTWDQVFEIAKSFNQTKDGVNYVGLAVSDHHMTKLNNFGLSYVDSATNLSTYDDERWKAIAEIFRKPAEDPGYRDFMAKYENKIADSKVFYEGRAAMFAALVHHTGNENFERADFNWDMVSIPTFKENPGIGGQAYPEYAAVASFSENKDAAVNVIKYMISEEFQMKYAKKGIMPVLTSKDVQAAYGSESYKDKNNLAVFYNPFAPVMVKTKFDGDVERAFTGQKNDLALGKIDVNTMLRTAKEEADKKIAEKNGN
ncbi:ABC transporter substrate-binding protein [Paenibacillus thailandensis]|uniref:ABC transporter substrate-binding protein n=1 Tax=Paenibacillus thailandensis TaxID=393250 RepID=A0ABW5R312_9BACL